MWCVGDFILLLFRWLAKRTLIGVGTRATIKVQYLFLAKILSE